MTDNRMDELLSEAAEYVDSLRDETMDDSEALETLVDLLEVADEAEDLVSTVELENLLDSVDVSELPEAIDFENIPEAIEERNPEAAIRVRKLLQLTDLSELFRDTDVRELIREKREFDDELDDLTDPDDEGDDALEGGTGDVLEDEERGELTEAALQSKIDDAVGEFRESLGAAHERLRRLREENEARTGERGTQPSSLNPTAYSTLAAARGDIGSATRHSTVPRSVRHSDAPSRERIYGRRFERWIDDG